MSKQKKITPLGQQILDLICDRVAKSLGMGFIGWSIGGAKDITHYVAKKLGRSDKSIDGALARLVSLDLLSNDLEEDNLEGKTIRRELAIRHAGWEAYSRFDPKNLWDECQNYVDEGEDILEFWRHWGGIDGMPCPYEYDIPNWDA
jgi:hypothetical protein